jgi:inner membrane protein
MAWWLWVLIGLGLLTLELVVPTDFFVLFLGVAGLVVGAAAATGLAVAAWAQWVLFAIVALAALLLLRKPLRDRLTGPPAGGRVGELAGTVAVLSEDLRPGDVGKAELRGTVWSVRSEHDGVIERGRRCRVDRAEGLLLWVTPETAPVAPQGKREG